MDVYDMNKCAKKEELRRSIRVVLCPIKLACSPVQTRVILFIFLWNLEPSITNVRAGFDRVDDLTLNTTTETQRNVKVTILSWANQVKLFKFSLFALHQRLLKIWNLAEREKKEKGGRTLISFHHILADNTHVTGRNERLVTCEKKAHSPCPIHVKGMTLACVICTS